MSLLQVNKRDRAIEVLDTAPAEPTASIAGRLCLFLRLGLQGEREAAVSCVGDEFKARAWRVEWWSEWMAQCYALIDEHQLALDWLENAADRGYINYPYFAEQGATWRRLDDHDRFRKLLGKIRSAWERFDRSRRRQGFEPDAADGWNGAIPDRGLRGKRVQARCHLRKLPHGPRM